MSGGREAALRLKVLLDRALAVEATRPDHGGDDVVVPRARFARALLQGRVLPLLDDDRDRDPAHVVVFGGTNGGKSTVTNLLLGEGRAAMAALARHTQVPEAFHAGDPAFLDVFPDRLPGYERYVPGAVPHRSDEEVRAGGFVPGVVVSAGSPRPYVIWDTPDVSTEEGMRFLPGVIDVIGLADLVLFVVTRESYADHRGRLLRSLVLDASIPALVVVNKEDDRGGLLEDVRQKIAGTAGSATPHPAVGPDRILALPPVVGDDAGARLRSLAATDAARALVDRVGRELDAARADRPRRTIALVDHLLASHEELLRPLAEEIDLAATWRRDVTHARDRELLAAYRRSYLDGEAYDEFNLAVARFLDQLELPGPGRIVARAASLARRPMRAVLSGVRGAFGSRSGGPSGSGERAAVDDAVARFLAATRARAQSLAQDDDRPRWSALSDALSDPGFADARRAAVDAAYPPYRRQVDEAVRTRSRRLVDLVEARPSVRRALQGSKLILDTAATVGVVLVGGLDPTDLIIAPLVAPVLRVLLEALGHELVEGEKRSLKDEQLALLGRTLDAAVVVPTANALAAPAAEDELRAVPDELTRLRRAIEEIR